MKKFTFGFLLILILNQACSKKGGQITNDDNNVPTCENCDFTCLEINESNVITNNCLMNWECNFNVIPQSRVDLNEFEGLANGAKNAFQMIYSTQGDLAIADDEFKNILVFELAESQNSFSVEDAELEAMQVHFRRVCYCIETDFIPVTSGCIQGEKQLDGSWFIQGKLNLSYSFGDFDVKFDAQFVN